MSHDPYTLLHATGHRPKWNEKKSEKYLFEHLSRVKFPFRWILISQSEKLRCFAHSKFNVYKQAWSIGNADNRTKQLSKSSELKKTFDWWTNTTYYNCARHAITITIIINSMCTLEARVSVILGLKRWEIARERLLF